MIINRTKKNEKSEKATAPNGGFDSFKILGKSQI
jgi:hypothetical protein